MAQKLSLATIANHCGATIQGDPDYLISAVASIESVDETSISFVRDKKYLAFLEGSSAGAIILPPHLAEYYAGNCLIHRNPYLAYAKTVGLLYPSRSFPNSIAKTAIIADNVELGEGCFVGDHVVIESGTQLGDHVVIEANCFIGERCKIGSNTHLYANVNLGSDTQIGECTILHFGAAIAADGFGFAPDHERVWHKIPQVGSVMIGDDVEIGANTCIDRAALGVTHIGDGVKLDNLIQIGHNVQIGEHTAVAACTAIAGSAKIGRYCQIAGMCAIAGHLEIADNVVVTATSMVTHSIKQAGVYSAGTTVKENATWRKNAVRFNQLDQMARRLAQVEKQLAALQTKE